MIPWEIFLPFIILLNHRFCKNELLIHGLLGNNIWTK